VCIQAALQGAVLTCIGKQLERADIAVQVDTTNFRQALGVELTEYVLRNGSLYASGGSYEALSLPCKRLVESLVEPSSSEDLRTLESTPYTMTVLLSILHQ